jgi:hypothetical protein
MKEIQYLTKELKKYYMSDFENLLSFKGSDFWDIDDGLENILRQINSNNDVQTLYSKRYKPNPDYLTTQTDSYLEIAFTKEFESELISRLTNLKASFTCKNASLSISEGNTGENVNATTESKLLLGCKTNPDYFRIKHVKIELDSARLECHDIFWGKMGPIFYP